MDQNANTYRTHLLDSDSSRLGDEQNTLCSRVKTLLSQNCIFLRKVTAVPPAGSHLQETLLKPKHLSRHSIIGQNSLKTSTTKLASSANARERRRISSEPDSKETFLPEESSSSVNSDVIHAQPKSELPAPYYYGDIIRTRNLDASTIFSQTASKNSTKSPLKTRQLISILRGDKGCNTAGSKTTSSSVQTLTLDKIRTRPLIGDKSYIMDGLRVQLKNASTRFKGAATPTATPQRLRHQQVIRSQESHVSLRGWLYRLEGGALKQWKRRWCVLADYCLFYYKDMAETKLLGSALLPSFKINPCLSGDGISRKYSFKIEHSNMKTYYFAADTKEIQQQWMSALSMATIMQLSIFQTQKPRQFGAPDSSKPGDEPTTTMMMNMNNANAIVNSGNNIDNNNTDNKMKLAQSGQAGQARMMMTPNGMMLLTNGQSGGGAVESAHYQSYLGGGNCVSSTPTTASSAVAGQGAKLLYAPDGYPLSNMIDEQSAAARNELNNTPAAAAAAAAATDNLNNNIGSHFNNNHSSSAGINNNNNNNNNHHSINNNNRHSNSSSGNIPVKHIDDLNGLPAALYHPQQQQSPANLFAYHQQQQHPYQQKAYPSMPSYQYSIDPVTGQEFQQGFYPGSGAQGMVPPPKPRRAQAQEFFCEPQQYYSPQTGLIYDSYFAGPYGQQFMEPMFYNDMTGQQAYMPGYLESNNYMDFSHRPPHHMELDRPKRPHSADFLERSEEDLDDCEVAFHDPHFGDAKTANGITDSVGSKPKISLPQKILPTRPKSSFARYNDGDIGVELYDFPINLPISGRLNGYPFAEPTLNKQNFTSDDENRLNELAEASQQNHLAQQIVSPQIPLPAKSQLKLDNKTLFPSPLPTPSSQLPGYLSEAEMTFPSPYHSSPNPKPVQNGSPFKSSHSSVPNVPFSLPFAQQQQQPPNKQQNAHYPLSSLQHNNSTNNAHHSLVNGNFSQLPAAAAQDSSNESMIEPHRDELYKASQLFYRRTSSIISDSAVGASTGSSLYNAQSQSTNEDWSESGLPTTPATASQDSLTESREDRDLISINKNLQDKNLLTTKNDKVFEPKFFNGFDPKTPPKQRNVSEKINNLHKNIQVNNSVISGSSSPRNQLKSRENRLIDQGVYDLNINDNEESEIVEDDVLLAPLGASNPTAESIKFKLGQKVRTYRKPRPSSSSSTASSTLPSDILAQTLSKNDPQAPYYITDLMNEQQRKDLQKKLPSNPLPALLSRSTLDSARQAGTTTLCLKSSHIKQNSIDSTANSDHLLTHSTSHTAPFPYPDSIPLPSRLPIKTGNKSLDDYFGTFDSSESESLTGNAQVSSSEFGTRRKRRTKRRSKVSPNNSKTEKTDNASDSELHLRFRQRVRKNSNQRLYGSAGDFIGKSREELTLMLEKYRRQQSKLSTSCGALKIAMESEAKMAELDPCKAPEYHSRMAEFRRQLEETQQCVARKQPIIDRIDSLIRVTPDSALVDKNEDKKDDNIENMKRQQNILAVELDRVRGLLTHSTRALEAKAVENAKMEAEMQAARKKLKQVLENDKAEAEISRSVKLERELAHINQVIDNLHSRRQELNSAIENLKHPSTGSEDQIPFPEGSTILQIDEQLQAIVHPNGVKDDSSDSSSTSESNSGSEESSDAVCVGDAVNPQMLEQKYRAFLAANTPLIPLYENLGSNTTVIPSFLTPQQIFPARNGSDEKRKDGPEAEDDENDEFFTMNLPKDVQLISSIQSHQLQGCEFTPQAYHQFPANGNVMDEQLQKLFAFQQQQMQLQGQQQFLSPKNEIRTVREVKREAERRKHHQAQSAKINALIRSLPGNGPANGDNGNYSQMASHHFYMQGAGNDQPTESPITAPDLIQSTIH